MSAESTPDIGGRFRDIRVALKLDQAELGKLIGLRQGSISNIEVGAKRLTFSEVINLSEATGVPVEAFDPRRPMPQITTTIKIVRQVAFANEGA